VLTVDDIIDEKSEKFVLDQMYDMDEGLVNFIIQIEEALDVTNTNATSFFKKALRKKSSSVNEII